MPFETVWRRADDSTTPCPNCGEPRGGAIPATSGDGDHAPRPGHKCICSDCGAVLVFEDAMTLRMATDAEVAKMLTHSEDRLAYEAVQAVIAARPPNRA